MFSRNSALARSISRSWPTAPGIGMLKAEAPTANRITEAVQSGIKVVACENTMTTQKLTKADMHAAIGYAPSGVVEIMKRQGEGWAYVRP